MSESLARWIFWVGTLVSVVLLLALTVDTHRQFAVLTHADKLDDHVVAGKRAFEQHNCNDCHTILGFGGYYAPDLTRAYSRLGEDAIRRRLAVPEAAFADSFRKMPQQNIPGVQLADLIAYLRWVNEIENHDWPPQDSSQRWESTNRLLAASSLTPGAALIKDQNCLRCHTLGTGGGNIGPRLEWVGSRRTAEWIAEFVWEPEKYAPGTGMPAFDQLSDAQRLLIGQFIVAAAARPAR
jgi:nitric oxide reductase subunit C